MSVLKNVLDAAQGKAPLGTLRSSQWPSVRAAHLKKNPKCALCEGTSKLEVHHIKPFHLSPELELEPTNLITLCEAGTNGIICHMAFGHLGNYKSVNPTVKSDTKTWNKKIKNRKQNE
jgi:hypothetical protein